MKIVKFHKILAKPTILTVCLVITKNSYAQDDLTNFSQNVTTHVLYHELAPALIQEFNLPVLANEEAMADSFATNYITQYRRDMASEIILGRVRSWMFEGQEIQPTNYDIKGEHLLDIRRAYQVACLFYGADPNEWSNDIAFLEFSNDDLADCSDTAPDQIEGWAEILAPYFLPEGKTSDMVEIIYGESPLTERIKSSEILESFADNVRRFDWIKPITVHF